MTADITSTPVNVQYLDNIGLEIAWTASGSPSGTIYIQGSNSYDAVLGSGTFYSLTFDPALSQPDGTTNANGYLVSLSNFPYAWLRVFYDRTSGGTANNLTVYITAKEL
jgi:hypothetical protein